jgi:Ca2+:H+ antiporter
LDVDLSNNEPSGILSQYWDIIFGVISIAVALLLHLSNFPLLTTIFSAIGIGLLSVTVSEIAEILAQRLDEPYASFVLTFSAVAVEIILLYMILRQVINSPEVIETVKGGIISAVIVDMNVLLGLAVFIGGLSFKEQKHNEDTSSTYTTILLVAVSALLVPSVLEIINKDSNALTMASRAIAILLGIFYIIILIFQTKTHSHFFKQTAKSRLLSIKNKTDNESESEIENDYIFYKLSNVGNLIAIFVAILLIGLASEMFAKDGVKIFYDLGISAGIAGLIIAIISVTPEIFTAIRAARNDQVQRVVNIAMGASTVSILITVPALMILAYISGIDLDLDFNSLQIGALLLTIILAWKTTDDGETNYIEGIAHLMFFMCYVVISVFY